MSNLAIMNDLKNFFKRILIDIIQILFSWWTEKIPAEKIPVEKSPVEKSPVGKNPSRKKAQWKKAQKY